MSIFHFFKAPKINQPQIILDYLAKKGNPGEKIIAFDTETTGLNPNKDQIVSIGAVAINDFQLFISQVFYQELAVFTSHTHLNKESFSIHEIISAPSQQTEKEVLLQFIEFIENHSLLGHHVHFDIKIVNTALKKHFNIQLYNHALDTFSIALKHDFGGQVPAQFPQKKYTLDALCSRFQIEVQDRHHALGDAFLTARLYWSLIRNNK
ncbi:MAG: exonuclease domain-containing protein [Spirosomataceae bacterium]